jgi:hypothetical protein
MLFGSIGQSLVNLSPYVKYANITGLDEELINAVNKFPALGRNLVISQ